MSSTMSYEFNTIRYVQIQAWLEPPHRLIHYGESCVNHYTTTQGNSITQNVWSQMLFLTPKIGHWKNWRWIQILDTALAIL